MQPAGGTELQHSFLEKFVSKDFGKRIPTINLIFKSFLRTKNVIKNMIGMCLIHIGIMKSLDTFLIFPLKDVWC